MTENVCDLWLTQNYVMRFLYSSLLNEPSCQAYLYSLHLWGLYDGGLGCLDDPVNLHRLPVGQLN